MPERFWSAVLLEKVVLLALISVIFAQVLPDISASNLGVAIGVTVLVVLNASVTQFLRRRGRSWSSSAQEFAAMLVINTVIVTVDAVLGRGDEVPALNTLFFVVLLSLLIALFDRFRATREPDVARTPADRHSPGPMASPIPCLIRHRPPTAPTRADGSTNFLVRSVGASSCAPRSGSARCRWRCSPPMPWLRSPTEWTASTRFES